MSKRNETLSDTAEREIVITRLLNAPRELVFQAWTDPKHLNNWWGPRGFTNTFKEINTKTGGQWLFTMHGPMGDFPNRIRFEEVVKPERLVYLHDSGVDNDPAQFEVVVTFEAQGNKTKLTMRSLFQTTAIRDMVVREFKATEGGNQTIDKLEEELVTMSGDQFTVFREFNAPRNLVWKVYTEAEHLANWWGPKGFKMLHAKLDLKPGGLFHYCMQSPDGNEMWGRFVYRDVVVPERVIFTNSFSDAKGNAVRAPFNPNWPLEVLNFVTLTERNGKTTITLKGGAFNATDEERKIFAGAQAMMEQGFKGTFDQLDEYLAKF